MGFAQEQRSVPVFPTRAEAMATPHVSAVAALIWSCNTSWTVAQIRDALDQTAKDVGASGRDTSYGYGWRAR
ncbi:MAG: hypothetical protein DMF83_25205 [Acidobacteria bacterium]|nr:MAG: hypothetical protein DMF83_25205 [Acidobacteriota bacterium]